MSYNMYNYVKSIAETKHTQQNQTTSVITTTTTTRATTKQPTLSAYSEGHNVCYTIPVQAEQKLRINSKRKETRGKLQKYIPPEH